MFTGKNIMSFRSLFSMFAVLVVSAALILGLAVTPAMAGSSSVTKGTEQLPKIDAAAEQVAEKSAPMGLEEVEERNEGGLNEIQGSADANKMHKADTSKPGTALAKKIDKALDKVVK
jgi:Cu/Ag efflux protein CusF